MPIIAIVPYRRRWICTGKTALFEFLASSTGGFWEHKVHSRHAASDATLAPYIIDSILTPNSLVPISFTFTETTRAAFIEVEQPAPGVPDFPQQSRATSSEAILSWISHINANLMGTTTPSGTLSLDVVYDWIASGMCPLSHRDFRSGLVSPGVPGGFQMSWAQIYETIADRELTIDGAIVEYPFPDEYTDVEAGCLDGIIIESVIEIGHSPTLSRPKIKRLVNYIIAAIYEPGEPSESSVPPMPGLIVTPTPGSTLFTLEAPVPTFNRVKLIDLDAPALRGKLSSVIWQRLLTPQDLR